MRNQERSRAFYGQSLQARDFGQFVLTERKYSGGYTTPVHAHECPIFCVVLDGAYQEQHCNRAFDCTPETILFHAANEEHLERFLEPGVRSLIVELDPKWLERVREISSIAIRSTAAMESWSLRSLGSKLDWEFRSGDTASQLIIEGLLFEMTGEFFRAEQRCETRPPRWLVQATDMIHTNFDHRLTLSGIAGEVGVHPIHLAQTFRRFHRCTVGEYVRRRRIEYACERLVHTDLPCIELALSAGFADQSHFGRIFRRMVGLSPSRYRANARAGNGKVRFPSQ